MMVSNDVGSLLVIDEGRLIGIITERDCKSATVFMFVVVVAVVPETKGQLRGGGDETGVGGMWVVGCGNGNMETESLANLHGPAQNQTFAKSLSSAAGASTHSWKT